MKTLEKLWRAIGLRLGWIEPRSTRESSERIAGFLRGKFGMPIHGREEDGRISIQAIQNAIVDVFDGLPGHEVDVKYGKLYVYKVSLAQKDEA